VGNSGFNSHLDPPVSAYLPFRFILTDAVPASGDFYFLHHTMYQSNHADILSHSPKSLQRSNGGTKDLPPTLPMRTSTLEL
jgi:hypothetical protein